MRKLEALTASYVAEASWFKRPATPPAASRFHHDDQNTD
jgi:hypothetical protein